MESSPKTKLSFSFSPRRHVDIGPGSMIWTIILQNPNGDIESKIASGSYDKNVAWMQAKTRFRNRIMALVPGSHQVVVKK